MRCAALLRWGCRRLRRVVDVSGFFVILQAVVSVDFFVVSVFLYWQFLQLLPCPVGEAVDLLLLLLSGLRLRRQRCRRLSDAILRRCFYYLLLLYFFSLSLGYVFMFGDGVAVIYIHNLWLPYLRAMCGCVRECGVYRERRVCVSCCHYEWLRAVFDCILNCVNELSWLTHRHRKLLICKLIVCTAFYTWIFPKWPFALTHTHTHLAHACTCSCPVSLTHSRTLPACFTLSSQSNSRNALSLSLARIRQKHEKLHAPKYARIQMFANACVCVSLCASTSIHAAYSLSLSLPHAQWLLASVSFKLILAFFMCLHSRRLVSSRWRPRPAFSSRCLYVCVSVSVSLALYTCACVWRYACVCACVLDRIG